MKRNSLLLHLLVLFLAVFLVACGGPAVNQEGNGTTAATTATPVLSTDYDNALPVQAQLALGTVQLETTGQAVDETQAAQLLPLWQALQSLAASDTTAQAEIDAVVRQIAAAMTAEQMAAIRTMALTTDSLTELAESGALGRGGFGRAGGAAGAEGNGPANGFPGEGPPGGIPGSGPGGGAGPGGGFGNGPGAIPGAGGGELSADDIATRQALRDSDAFQEQALTFMVVRLLQTKTGTAPENAFGAIAETIYSVAGEAIGLTADEVRQQMAGGATLASIIEEHGGDVAAVRADLLTALQALSLPGDLDPAQTVDRWLGTAE